jgi:histidinol-phosphate aminotransferase
VPVDRIFVGNGSDEPIDLVYRVFCEPGIDNVVSIAPTYGMYKVAAQINDVEYREVLLEQDFSLNPEKILEAVDGFTKLIFICSPNNPTGNLMDEIAIEKIATSFNGLVIVDEAYMDFSGKEGYIKKLDDYPNIIVFRTFSKAWAMAGLRIGLAYAQPEIIKLLSSIKYPYNIGSDTQTAALKFLRNRPDDKVRKIIEERKRVAEEIESIQGVECVYPSDANFLLVRFSDSVSVYNRLIENGIVVRDRSKQPLCSGCLRLTIGLPKENDKMIYVLKGGNVEEKTGRRVVIERETKETSIFLEMDLDGNLDSSIETGIPFFNHMLDQLTFHSGISIRLDVTGDLEVDEHHTIEDTAIVLGEAIYKALGTKEGIARYGFLLPMDDSVAQVAIDLGGRAYLNWDVKFCKDVVGGITADMYRHFFYSLAIASKATIYISAKGDNDHHIAESIFKAFARSLKMAVKKDDTNYKLPSTKGSL